MHRHTHTQSEGDRCSLSSKDLMVKVVQNVPTMLVYLPSQLNVRSQVGFSGSRRNSSETQIPRQITNAQLLFFYMHL